MEKTNIGQADILAFLQKQQDREWWTVEKLTKEIGHKLAPEAALDQWKKRNGRHRRNGRAEKICEGKALLRRIRAGRRAVVRGALIHMKRAGRYLEVKTDKTGHTTEVRLKEA